MKTRLFAPFPVFCALLLGGCGSIDLTPAGNPERVLNGVVSFNGALPANAEVLVRVIENTRNDPVQPRPDLPVTPGVPAERGERVLGEARMDTTRVVQEPVPFKVEFTADDAVLRRGLTVDVRVSYGGKVRMRTINAHIVTLASAPFRQEVWVQSVQ
jgi:uncharacterized lipoprotein YbaY